MPLEARHDEEVLGEPIQPLRVDLDVVRDGPAVRVVGIETPEHLRAAVDRGDGGPQLMRDDADERAVEVLRLALLVHPAPALDRAGEEIRDGDEEVRVVDAERPAMRGMDAEDAPRAVTTRDDRRSCR